MVHKAKSLVKSKGILSMANPNQGHSLGNDTIVLVQNFFVSGEISRIMPGKKDCVSIKVNDTRISVQKRLLLGSLKEIYQQFKDQFPAEKIGFSRFAELCPKHGVLAGASGTHVVCVCTIHQNTKLMMIGGKLEELTANREVHLKHYNHCIVIRLNFWYLIPSKRLAAKASLQRPYSSQIMTPHQLFDWAIQNIKGVQIKYRTMDDYGQEEIFLEERLKISRTIPSTQKLHCFKSLSNTKILTRSFSNSSIAKEERAVHLHKTEIPSDEIN